MNLRQTIIGTFAYYNNSRVPADAVVEMYLEDLNDLPEQEAIVGYHTYRRNPKNKTFPLPAQIREILRPELSISPEAKAREIAARISGAIVRFGYPNPSGARSFIGEDGWAIVERQGGWSYLCENMGVNVDPGTYQAQTRDLLISNCTYGDALPEALGVCAPNVLELLNGVDKKC